MAPPLARHQVTVLNRPARYRRLENLPEEIVSNIACRLASDDLFALRLTCGKLEVKTFHDFSRTYFVAKCVHISTDSLKTLMDISRSTRLRGYVKQIWISPVQFEAADAKCNCSLTTSLPYLPVEAAEARRTYALDQQEIHNTGRACVFLTKAFKAMPALSELYWVTHIEQIPFGVDYRGRARVGRLCGYDLSRLTKPSMCQSIHWQRDVMNLLLRAMSQSGLKPKLFEMLESDQSDPMCAAHLIGDLKLRKLARKCLGNITTLSLHFMVPDVLGPKVLHCIYHRKLGETFPNLVHFSLRTTQAFDNAIHGYVEDTEAADGFANMVLTGLRHTQLLSLRLHSVIMEDETLCSTLEKCHNLKRLVLDRVDLTESEDSNTENDSWFHVLEIMVGLTALEHLHLAYLSDSSLTELAWFYSATLATRSDSQAQALSCELKSHRHYCGLSPSNAPWSFCIEGKEYIRTVFRQFLEEFKMHESEEIFGDFPEY